MHGSFRRLLYTVAACATLRECQGGVDSSGKPPPPEGVPDRSLTFESYFNDPSFRPHIPVYTSEVDVVSYVPDKIVSLWDRVALPASHDRVRHLRTYKRPRQIEDVWGEGWDELTGEAAGLFELSVQQGRMVLLVNMSSAHELYAPLGATGRVNHYDPVTQDGIAPFSTDVGAERQEAAYRKEAAQQAARRAEGEHATEEEEQVRNELDIILTFQPKFKCFDIFNQCVIKSVYIAISLCMHRPTAASHCGGSSKCDVLGGRPCVPSCRPCSD